MVGSSSLVAYGFARYPLPRKNFLFMIVMATIILPGAVTLIPTYAVFTYIGWVGTCLPGITSSSRWFTWPATRKSIRIIYLLTFFCCFF